MPVSKFVEYANKETIDALEGLWRQALTGEVTGVLFAAIVGPKKHVIGMTGKYAEDPMMAAAVTVRMQHKLNEMADGLPSGLTN